MCVYVLAAAVAAGQQPALYNQRQYAMQRLQSQVSSLSFTPAALGHVEERPWPVFQVLLPVSLKHISVGQHQGAGAMTVLAL